NTEIQKSLEEGVNANNLRIIEKMPTVKVSNYAYNNTGNLTFINKAAIWGLDQEAFSNGAAYVDLDNDGDLDLVVNNINQPAFIYENTIDKSSNNKFIKVKLSGDGKNSLGIGAKISVYSGGLVFYQEQMLSRGFQSSIDPVLNFGLGEMEPDSLIIIWPDLKSQTIKNPGVNKTIHLDQKKALELHNYHDNKSKPPLFEDISHSLNIDFIHKENNFVDFNRESLIPHMLSTEGPKMTTADINGDGLDDFFIGGASNQTGKIFLQKINQNGDVYFESINEHVLSADKECEDVGAVFFDADGDGDLDLYVVSGGNEWFGKDKRLSDRLYLNIGNDANDQPLFKKSLNNLPELYANGSCVAVADYDNDGDLDLFVGSRSISWEYGISPESYLLENDGLGNFAVVGHSFAPGLSNIGMVTDAVWADINNDQKPDLIVVGEWMPITVFENRGNVFKDITAELGLSKTNGWYNSIHADDFDGDGYIDFVTGNLGLNSTLKGSEENPVHLYIKDFDNDGKLDQFLTYYKQGLSYPMASRDELVSQLVSYKKKYIKHSDYSDSQLEDIFKDEELKDAEIKIAYNFNSLFVKNNAGTKFTFTPLPIEAQFSPVFGISSGDFDKDGNKDILLTGNFYSVGPKRGRYDASFGSFLKGNGKGGFESVQINESGFIVYGETRDIKIIKSKDEFIFLISKNSDKLQLFKLK
ncbi:MAG: FG-GAP-like repeat-containing protein, partial [Bacteroidota bacterium]|nr:FG-GAP-like repeat-containing protein [Bacteroidota bacterium]